MIVRHMCCSLIGANQTTKRTDSISFVFIEHDALQLGYFSSFILIYFFYRFLRPSRPHMRTILTDVLAFDIAFLSFILSSYISMSGVFGSSTGLNGSSSLGFKYML